MTASYTPHASVRFAERLGVKMTVEELNELGKEVATRGLLQGYTSPRVDAYLYMVKGKMCYVLLDKHLLRVVTVLKPSQKPFRLKPYTTLQEKPETNRCNS